ncbi:NADH-quinone oxidoreductase subunit J [Kaistia algarum]|nr:NADH-quinone oxidoreductase subunit J [Kaistia algarum]
MPFPADTTAGGFLLVLAILVPIAGILLIWSLGSRQTERIALATLAVGAALAFAIGAELLGTARPVIYLVGGWKPPLGLALRADGLSVALIVLTAIIIAATGLFAKGQFGFDPAGPEKRGPMMFWTLLLGISAALNLIFLGDDLFNLFVAIELVTFTAVPLVCLDGRTETMRAALRYLLFALLGSVMYLLGTALIYSLYGTLDIVLLKQVVQPTPLLFIAVALMTVGLLAKTALFPLHIWLPAAHAGAPAAASAVLSALVVKGSFFIILRLWFDVLPDGVSQFGTQILGGLGALAILFGSVIALRQARLKLLIAYSTVAQIGYLFLVFPLATGTGASEPWASIAWTGGVLQLASHAFAKAAMFMAAGLVYDALGHDRISGLAGAARIIPLTFLAFGLGGMSLMGLPPSGGFSAKWLMLNSAVGEGQWWWALIILIGGLLAAGYVFRVLVPAAARPRIQIKAKGPVSRCRELVALTLAVIALAIGFIPLEPSAMLQIGRGVEAGVLAP